MGVLWAGGMEVLRAVLHLLVDSRADCGSRLLRMDNTVLYEGLLGTFPGPEEAHRYHHWRQ